MSAATASKAPASKPKQHFSEQEVAQQYQQRKSELQGIAQKIGELESEADEHKLVIDTLTEAQTREPERKCFRLIGGVLVERTVREVLPALETNAAGLKQIMEQLVKQYKQREQEMQAFQREYGDA